MNCALNTNGGLLRPGWEEILPRFAYIRVSVDAGSAEDYARIRSVPLAAYAKTLCHLTELADACRTTDCTVGAGFVLTPDNHAGLLNGIAAIRDTGAEYVRIAFMQSTDVHEPYAAIADEVAQLRVQMLALNREGFDVIDLFSQVLGTEPAGALCGSQWIDPYIGANLKVYRCCYTSYTDVGQIGSLSDMSFADWVKSPDVREALKTFDARRCGTCPIENKNAAIRYMTDPKPPHVDFI